MVKGMRWKEVYDLWNYGCFGFPKAISDPVTAEAIPVGYDGEGYFYGYDWLENDGVQERKRLIAEDITAFLYFTHSSNKGTIRTVQMLAEARDEEERAAIWIAATAFELMERHQGEGIARCAGQVYDAACAFLRERYVLWHHAMRKLVPEIMIPYAVLDSMQCRGAEAVMGLIQTNVMLIRSCYTPLLYSSIQDKSIEKDVAERHSLRL